MGCDLSTDTKIYCLVCDDGLIILIKLMNTYTIEGTPIRKLLQTILISLFKL